MYGKTGFAQRAKCEDLKFWECLEKTASCALEIESKCISDALVREMDRDKTVPRNMGARESKSLYVCNDMKCYTPIDVLLAWQLNPSHQETS